MEVGLEHMRSENRLLWLVGCVGALRLNLPIAKFPIRYLVGQKTLICLSEIRNGISNLCKTTRSNTDTRLNSEEFYESAINQKISMRDLGGRAFNDFAEHLSQAGELKREEGMGESITESKSLMGGHQIGNNSLGNSEISGSLSGRIAKTLIYGKERKSAAGLEIGKIKKALSDFPRK